MFLLYTFITGLCTYSCFRYSKNRRYTNLLFDRFHVEAPKHMMSLIEFTEETNDDDSHLYCRMYTDHFYDDYLFDEYPSPLVGGVNAPLPQEYLTWTQLLQDQFSDQMSEKFRRDTENELEEGFSYISTVDGNNNVEVSDRDDTPSVVVPFPTQYEELYMNPRKYKIMKKRKYFGNDQRPQEDASPDNILEKIRDNIQKKQLLDFLQQPISPDHKIKAYEKAFPTPVFSSQNILAGGLMKDFDAPEF
jgi:hypothetical protein